VEDAAGIGRYLDGAIYPATKQQLVARAYSNGASDGLLAAFHRLPEREYISARDVRMAIDRYS
jgi:Protein of unknown function (DUF2795)